MPSERVLDTLPRTVTPEAGEGALGTWRFRAGPGLWARITGSLMAERVLPANHGRAGRARCQPERFAPWGKAATGKPRSEPDWGKPAVRDRREAWGNVAYGRPGPPARNRKGGAGHSGLTVHAPQIYPNSSYLLAVPQPLPGRCACHHGAAGTSQGRKNRRSWF